MIIGDIKVMLIEIKTYQSKNTLIKQSIKEYFDKTKTYSKDIIKQSLKI